MSLILLRYYDGMILYDIILWISPGSIMLPVVFYGCSSTSLVAMPSFAQRTFACSGGCPGALGTVLVLWLRTPPCCGVRIDHGPPTLKEAVESAPVTLKLGAAKSCPDWRCQGSVLEDPTRCGLSCGS